VFRRGLSGQNLPISADQISHVLGSDAVKNLAAKAGISPDQQDHSWLRCYRVSIDKLTPNATRAMPAAYWRRL